MYAVCLGGVKIWCLTWSFSFVNVVCVFQDEDEGAAQTDAAEEKLTASGSEDSDDEGSQVSPH